jgi:acetyl-CoA acyltransferase
MQEAVLVDCLRTAVGRAPRGTLRNARPDDLAATVIRRLIEKYPQTPADEIDDVILGCAMPEAESGMNMARNAALLAGFIIAGGSESMSLLPKAGNKFSPNPWFVDHRPEIYMSMGLTGEQLRRKYDISREDQDAFALRSHQNALRAQAEHRFDDEIVPFVVETTIVEDRKPKKQSIVFDKDEGPRADTSLEALTKLRPAFDAQGTITAGNASQMSDGAAATLVMSEPKARELGLKPVARLVSFAVGGVPPEIMGIGPVVAIPKALAMAGLKLKDIDLIELNEAFAAQALAVIRQAGLDLERLNVNGGAIALGHPLGCTGAKLTATILGEMERQKSRYGMVTMCVGGGQGAAGVFERL